MRNLFAFLLRYNLFIIFTILMGVSIWMYLSYNSYQRSRLLQATASFTARVTEINDGIGRYFNLSEANQQLSEENAQLRTLLAAHSDTINIADTSDAIKYIPARVISNSFNRKYNYFIIDKGRAHGVRPDQGVVSTKGVVGIITEVTKNYSSAISLINLNTQISARLKNTLEIGRIIWEGEDPYHTQLLDIPTHIVVNKGDTIVTSGYSHIFSADIPIGIVDSVSFQSGDHFYNIRIKTAENFNALYHVYVINNPDSDTLQYLENSFIKSQQ